MCGTCGCGTGDNGISLSRPSKDSANKEINGDGNIHGQEHHQGHDHGHHHHHHEHGHSHGHDHSHGHVHKHSHESDLKNTVLEVEKNILLQNEVMAARNRGYFEGRNIFALNLVSSPGSGKTSLLEKTLKDLKEEIPFAVIEGDQQTMQDANRIDALDVPVIQINTGKGCHLESDMVHQAVKELDLSRNSILMIENVGNLVCPSMFDLGENKRVVIISTTEGEDKPLKYPDMFHSSDVCVINKTDLLPYLDFDVEKLKSYALQVNPELEFFEVSATKGEGMQKWYSWLKSSLAQLDTL